MAEGGGSDIETDGARRRQVGRPLGTGRDTDEPVVVKVLRAIARFLGQNP